MRDKVVSPTLIANGCPQLSLSGIEELDGILVDSVHDGAGTAQKAAEITLSPASSHPSKKCTIEIAVVSDGGGGTSISTEEVDIKAAQTSSNTDSNKPPNSNDSDSGDSNEEQTTISNDKLPGPGIFITFSALIIAATIRRDCN